jgi:hypothetical protein
MEQIERELTESQQELERTNSNLDEKEKNLANVNIDLHFVITFNHLNLYFDYDRYFSQS